MAVANRQLNTGCRGWEWCIQINCIGFESHQKVIGKIINKLQRTCTVQSLWKVSRGLMPSWSPSTCQNSLSDSLAIWGPWGLHSRLHPCPTSADDMQEPVSSGLSLFDSLIEHAATSDKDMKTFFLGGIIDLSPCFFFQEASNMEIPGVYLFIRAASVEDCWRTHLPRWLSHDVRGGVISDWRKKPGSILQLLQSDLSLWYIHL